MNKKVILVSHGDLALAMAESVQMIIGKNDDIMSFGLKKDGYCGYISEQIKNIANENKNTQYIVIADLLGGSICNECVSLSLLSNVKVISGMNMKLVIELILEESEITDEIIENKIKSCKEYIINISESTLMKNIKDYNESFFK